MRVPIGIQRLASLITGPATLTVALEPAEIRLPMFVRLPALTFRLLPALITDDVPDC